MDGVEDPNETPQWVKKSLRVQLYESDLEHCLLLLRSHSYFGVVHFVLSDHSKNVTAFQKKCPY